MTQDTYQAGDGRTITRITLAGKEGDMPFHGIWVEGEGHIGDRVIGEYRCREDGWVETSGEMFGESARWSVAPSAA